MASDNMFYKNWMNENIQRDRNRPFSAQIRFIGFVPVFHS